MRFIWRGAGQGPKLSMGLTSIWTVRNGRIFYLEFFWDHAEALNTVGLEG